MEDNSSKEDLMELRDPSEVTILHTLQERFSNRRIYTNISGTLVALNPCEKYLIYDDSVMQQYHTTNRVAHVFGIAQNAVKAIAEGSDSENIILSGESGSGKSFNARQIMKYLSALPGSKLNETHTNALLTVFNSFATAKTIKNESATRFGYAADFLFKKNVLSGLNVRSTLPIEGSRVVQQKPGERNYNVFYEILNGLPQELRSKYGVRDGQRFFYVNQGKTIETPEIDEKNFSLLEDSLEILGFSDSQIQVVYKTLIAILHIGNVFFKQKRTAVSSVDCVEVGNESEVKWASHLLEIDFQQFLSTLTQKIVKTDEGFSTSPYNMGQSLDARDSLVVMLYEELFNWVLNRISLNFKCTDSNATITVVDYYGFEKYNSNGLEQLLINTVNEKMEHVFVRQSFNETMENYIREGVHAPVEIPQNLDNSKLLDLLLKKPHGLLNLLDDECKFPKGSDETYLQHCNLNHLDKGVYGKARNRDRNEFSVRHYAGTTWYLVQDYLHRNKRIVPAILLKIFAESQNSIISMIFRPLATGRERADYTQYSGQQYTLALNSMAEKLFNGNSHFIRCIRSNNERQREKFDDTTVNRQIKAHSITELLLFRLNGYPVRIPFLIFAQNFRCILPSDIAMCQNQKEIIIDILEGQGIKNIGNFKIGRNYVFLREALYQRLCNARENARKEAGRRIQKTMRMYVVRKRYLQKRNATITLQAGLRGWKARKESASLREELLKRIGKQSRRSKRLEAYREGLQDPTEETLPSTVVGYLDMDSEVSDTLEKASSKSDDRPNTKKTNTYLDFQIKKRVQIEPVRMEAFADEYYKGHLLEIRREPIITPFLHKEGELDYRMSIEIFKLILKFMNDTKLNKTQLEDLARYIIQQGITNPCQRDEIFVQICNQCYRNREKLACERGYQLLEMAIGAFPPTENVIPMLQGFSETIPEPVGSYVRNTLQQRFKVPDSMISRLLPASVLEMSALRSHNTSAATVTMKNGEELRVETHPWITNSEIANRLLRFRGVGNPSGWTLELENDNKIYSSSGTTFFHDVLAELECGKQQNRKAYFLNFSNERTLPPVNSKKTPQPVVDILNKAVMSPVERRKARGMEPRPDSRRRDLSANPLGSPHTLPRVLRDRSAPQSPSGAKSPRQSRSRNHSGDILTRRSNDAKSPKMLPLSPRTRSSHSMHNDNRETNVSLNETIELTRVSQVINNPKVNEHGEMEDEGDYTYTMINKKRGSPRSKPRTPITSPPPLLSPEPTKQEIMNRKVAAQPYNNVMPSNDEGHNQIYVSNYAAYPNQMQMPMIQYVPVMMAPQMMPQMMPAMPGTTMGGPHMQYQQQMATQQVPQAIQYGHYPQNQYRMVNDVQNNNYQEKINNNYGSIGPGNNYETIRNGHDSRMSTMGRNEPVPSEYSGMSIASRIRRMPVPDHESNRDVDRFLDEVFDQVLSPEDMRAVDQMTAKHIAASIKGGRGAPSQDYDVAYDRTAPQGSAGYARVIYDKAGNDFYTSGSEKYSYIDRNQVGPSIPRARNPSEGRSKSLTRYRTYDEVDANHNVANVSQRSNGYSQIKESCVDLSPSPSRNTYNPERSDLPVPSTPVPPMPATNGTQPPVIMMMPVQIHDDGHMTPLAMANQEVLFNTLAKQQALSKRNSYMHSRDHSYENPSRRSYTPDDLDARKQQRFSSTPPLRSNTTPRKMRAVLQQTRQPPPQPVPQERTFTKPQPLPVEKAQHGLARVDMEELREPVVQNTVSNSEHLNPNRIRVPERNYLKEMQAREKQAVRQLKEKLKYLPPPVENVKVFMPKKPPPPPVIEERKQPEILIPEEPVWTHPAYFPEPVPDPIIPELRSEWVYDGCVERPPELQARIKTRIEKIEEPILQQQVAKPNEVPTQEKPAVKYLKQPWRLTIRKEMFFPNEQLDDIQVIDQVFHQIINDCRRAIAYRIRSYERDDVVAILKYHNIPPDMLNRQEDIPAAIKVEVIEAARKWPLYFSQIYEVVEERADESVSVLLSLAEHGIRLLMHTPLDKENPLKVQDHFSLRDIADVILENDEVVCLHTTAGITVRLRTKMATQVKNQIVKLCFGDVKGREFVKATCDYITNEPNLLSFRNGDIIEIVSRPEGDEAVSGWLYGKIESRYGNLPSNYVVAVDENLEEVDTPISNGSVVLSNNHDDLNGAPNNYMSEQHSILNGGLNGFDDHDSEENTYGGARYTMADFAIKYFRPPKGLDVTLKRGKKYELSFEDVAPRIKWTDKPISHSLLRLENSEQDKLAIDAFSSIMRYMGDETAKRGESMTDTVYKLLLICHKNQALRDEVYCQIIRQTTSNHSNRPDSWIKGWRLFSILTAYFECSLTLKPYLFNYLANNADDSRRAFHGTAQLCLLNLKQTLHYGGRKYLLSALEVEEITNGKILKRQVYTLPGGHKKVINTRSVTVTEEVIQELCNELNVRSPVEQQEFTLCHVIEKDNEEVNCANNDYILDICTEMEHKKLSFYFLLKRTVWVHPLRLDNPVFIDAMFFQIVPQYLMGAYVILQEGGNISASVKDDVILLAALLHLSSSENRDISINRKTVTTLIPGSLIEYRLMHADQWVERINKRLQTLDSRITPTQARAQFLEIISRWPLFGIMVFKPDEITTQDDHILPQLDLTIGKNGVSLVAPYSHQIFEQWSYDKIISTRFVTDHGIAVAEIVVAATPQNQVFAVRSRDAGTINRVLSQYKFVVEENSHLLS